MPAMRHGPPRESLTAPEQAARWLLEAHERRQRFTALPAEFAPRTADD